VALITLSKTAKTRKANLKKCITRAYKKHRRVSVCRCVRKSTVCNAEINVLMLEVKNVHSVELEKIKN